jgi:hypothetical protein
MVRLRYCAAALGSTHSCFVDSDFLVDAGEVHITNAKIMDITKIHKIYHKGLE